MCHSNRNCNRGKDKIFNGHVTTTRSIYGCGEYGFWLLVHKLLFTIQNCNKTAKTDNLRLLAGKNGIVNRQAIVQHFPKPANQNYDKTAIQFVCGQGCITDYGSVVLFKF